MNKIWREGYQKALKKEKTDVLTSKRTRKTNKDPHVFIRQQSMFKNQESEFTLNYKCFTVLLFLAFLSKK